MVPVGIAAATALVFAPALSCGFVWDDDFNLLGGADFRGFGARQLGWMLTSAHMGHYHPLTWLSFAIDYRLYGLDPWGYHLGNVLLHAANAVLVYVLLRELLGRFGPVGATTSDPTLPAALGALLFALHPLRVESVAWVTERRGLLCGLGSLACVLAYLRAHANGRRRRGWLATSLCAFVVALLSKASSMSIPLVLLVLDRYPLRRREGERAWALLAEKTPYLVLAGAVALRAAAAAREGSAVLSFEEHGVARRLVQAAWGGGFYLQRAVVPLRLSPLYPLETFDPWAPGVLGLAVATGAVTLATWRLRHRRPEVTAAWACYLLLLAPTLGLAQSGIQVAADRYTYVAMVPLVGLAAAGLQALRVSYRRGGRVAAVVVAVALIAALAVGTRAQIRVWQDGVTLWSQVVRFHPGSHDAWHNLGLGRLAAGDARGALADLDRAVALDPAFAPAYNTRATARETLHDLPGARADLDRAVALAPEWVDPYNNRGNVRLASGDVAGAISDYDHVLARAPGHVRAHYNRAVARERQHDAAGALADMDAVIALSPDYAYAYAMRARYRAALGDLAGAAADLEGALGLLPAGSADARTVEGYRAELRARLGDSAR